jgi:radical SAM superfamily enzyme YgiQ (UPF0313 family)
MKYLFFIGLIGMGIFLVMILYFIMPMPGSQQWDSLEFAYFLHSYRWMFRILFTGMVIIGAKNTFSTSQKWLPVTGIALVLAIYIFFNFKMTAERMFLEPETLTFSPVQATALADSSLVKAVEHSGDAKAYPIRYIALCHLEY